MPDSLFISKNPGEVTQLQYFTDQNDIHLTAYSFLEFRQVDFKLPTHFDVIFFGSPRAVVFFQSRYAIPSDTEIACVGGKTASLLKSMGHKLAFNGEGKGSISEVANEFRLWLGSRVVLFPVSSKSLGTISKGLSERQAIQVVCYETVIREKELDQKFDTYVFTSPSNVEGFFKANSIPESANVIAWGESTAGALEEYNIQKVETLEEPSKDALISIIKK